MNLSKWQEKKAVSDQDFAKKVKIHPSLLSHIRAGRRKPSPSLALRIEQATGGKVTLRELLFPEESHAE